MTRLQTLPALLGVCLMAFAISLSFVQPSNGQYGGSGTSGGGAGGAGGSGGSGGAGGAGSSGSSGSSGGSPMLIPVMQDSYSRASGNADSTMGTSAQTSSNTMTNNSALTATSNQNNNLMKDNMFSSIENYGSMMGSGAGGGGGGGGY